MNNKLVKHEYDHLVMCEGYTTIFWITHSNARAGRVEWLEKNGYIKRIDHEKHCYPTMRFSFPKPLKLE